MARAKTLVLNDTIESKLISTTVTVTRKSDGMPVECATKSVGGNAKLAREFLVAQSDLQVCALADVLIQRSDRQRAANGKDADTALLEEITDEVKRGNFARVNMIREIAARIESRKVA